MLAISRRQSKARGKLGPGDLGSIRDKKNRANRSLGFVKEALQIETGRGELLRAVGDRDETGVRRGEHCAQSRFRITMET